MTTPEPVAPDWPTRTSIETTAGVTLAAMSETEPGSRLTPGSTWDSSVPEPQRGLALGLGQVPAEPTADRADDEDGQQRQDGEPDREVAQQLLAAPRIDDDRPVLLRLVVDGGGAQPGGGVRVAPGVAPGVELHHGPEAVRRRPGRPVGGSCRPRCPVAGGPKARRSASAGGGGTAAVVGSAGCRRSCRRRRRGSQQRGLLPGDGRGPVTVRGASRSGASPNGPSAASGRAKASAP